jgi:predicted site-specific integrase-resolvase
MPKPAKRRVVIYARVSTQDQDPQMQLRELRSYAKHRAFTIAHEFTDHVSGATSERPELSKLEYVRDACNFSLLGPNPTLTLVANCLECLSHLDLT